MAFQPIETIGLFCARIDHWGDVGVTWRLARALTARGVRVLWWIDDRDAATHFLAPPTTQGASAPPSTPAAPALLTVRCWVRGAPSPADRALLAQTDAVVEAFACGFSPAWLTALADCAPAPTWIVLDHLAFGSWAAAVHGGVSPHPRLPLTARWCVPGFVPGSAGLPREPAEVAALDQWASDLEAVTGWLARHTALPATAFRRVSLFCYPDAPLAGFLTALAADPTPTLLWIPPGEPRAALARHGVVLPEPDPCGPTPPPPVAWPGTPHFWQPLPFLAPEAYDRLLWSSHLNWVRGEDSFVRAQWAGRPFVWSPYRRPDGGHTEFAAAFRAQFAGTWPLADCEADFTNPERWHQALSALPAWQQHCRAWRAQIEPLPVLADSVLGMIGQTVR